MASITIQHGHKNLVFAASVANETGAEFEENGQWITISDSPELTIPRYCFNQAFDPDGSRSHHGENLESIWRSLLLNKKGFLVYFGDTEIYISDNKPKDPRPQFNLRWPDQETRDRAQEWANRAGFESLTAYIVAAVDAFNASWAEKAGE